MPTVPARIALVTRMARLMSPVHTVAARPYSVSLAIRIASSSSANGITDSTGPKISSRAMLMSFDTSVNSVGVMKLPAARSPSPRAAAADQRAAIGGARLDQRENTFHLAGVDQRRGGDRRVERVAVADHPADHLGHREELVGHAPVHQRPGLRQADLPGQAER